MSTGAGPSKKPKLTTDLETVQSQLQLIREVRGKPSLSREEKLDILFVYFSITKQCLSDEQIRGPINTAASTAAMLGRGRSTVSPAIKEWTATFFRENGNVTLKKIECAQQFELAIPKLIILVFLVLKLCM